MSNKCLDDELYDIYIQDGKQVIESLREIYEKGRADTIDEVLDTIKNQRIIYYLAFANGGNNMDDFAWKIASKALDNIVERLKEK